MTNSANNINETFLYVFAFFLLALVFALYTKRQYLIAGGKIIFSFLCDFKQNYPFSVFNHKGVNLLFNFAWLGSFIWGFVSFVNLVSNITSYKTYLLALLFFFLICLFFGIIRLVHSNQSQPIVALVYLYLVFGFDTIIYLRYLNVSEQYYLLLCLALCLGFLRLIYTDYFLGLSPRKPVPISYSLLYALRICLIVLYNINLYAVFNNLISTNALSLLPFFGYMIFVMYVFYKYYSPNVKVSDTRILSIGSIKLLILFNHNPVRKYDIRLLLIVVVSTLARNNYLLFIIFMVFLQKSVLWIFCLLILFMLTFVFVVNTPFLRPRILSRFGKDSLRLLGFNGGTAQPSWLVAMLGGIYATLTGVGAYEKYSQQQAWLNEGAIVRKENELNNKAFEEHTLRMGHIPGTVGHEYPIQRRVEPFVPDTRPAVVIGAERAKNVFGVIDSGFGPAAPFYKRGKDGKDSSGSDTGLN